MNVPPGSRLPPGLYALCDDTVRPELPLLDKGRLLLEGGARVVQLRLKRTPLREGLAVARALARACRQAGARLVINDRVDLALLADADGVHVGDEDLPPRDARALLGPGRLLGVTVRDAAGARAALEAGADYVGLGPVFGTATKVVAAPVLGPERFAAAVRDCPLPVVGIGGVGLGNIAEVARAGAHGAAVVSDLLCADDVPARARALQQAFDLGARAATLGRPSPGPHA